MKYVFTILLIMTLSTSAFAQSKITAITYDMSIPEGEMTNYIDQTSFRGIGFDGRWFMQGGDSPLALGLSLAWQVFNQNVDGTVVFPNGALTGYQNRYLNSFPIMATAAYYFGSKDRLWLYLGVGVGTYYTIQRFEIGVIALEENNWHFGGYPEIGIHFPLEEMDIIINGRYNIAFESGESISSDSAKWTYWGINVGLAYRGW
jgi:outer membrane protein